mmetsp:Transcript_97567/g.198153  ORF Transcript_97567/g.198153 Transcript_97567/m.198153 type:complete len:399 (+) Transcript_97567:559-1755(+)
MDLPVERNQPVGLPNAGQHGRQTSPKDGIEQPPRALFRPRLRRDQFDFWIRQHDHSDEPEPEGERLRDLVARLWALCHVLHRDVGAVLHGGTRHADLQRTERGTRGHVADQFRVVLARERLLAPNGRLRKSILDRSLPDGRRHAKTPALRPDRRCRFDHGVAGGDPKNPGRHTEIQKVRRGAGPHGRPGAVFSGRRMGRSEHLAGHPPDEPAPVHGLVRGNVDRADAGPRDGPRIRPVAVAARSPGRDHPVGFRPRKRSGAEARNRRLHVGDGGVPGREDRGRGSRDLQRPGDLVFRHCHAAPPWKEINTLVVVLILQSTEGLFENPKTRPDQTNGPIALVACLWNIAYIAFVGRQSLICLWLVFSSPRQQQTQGNCLLLHGFFLPLLFSRTVSTLDY